MYKAGTESPLGLQIRSLNSVQMSAAPHTERQAHSGRAAGSHGSYIVKGNGKIVTFADNG